MQTIDVKYCYPNSFENFKIESFANYRNSEKFEKYEKFWSSKNCFDTLNNFEISYNSDNFF